MSQQLPLRIGFTQRAAIDNFIANGNEELAATLRDWLESGRGDTFFLWGPPGSGRTHLLSAACDFADSASRSWAYLPLGETGQLAPLALEGLEQRQLVCLDDLDAVAGDHVWEEALFHLYNRLRDRGRQLLVAACRSPAQLGLELADLRSRLGSGLCYHLAPLDDPGKLVLLKRQAKERGLTLSTDAAGYLLSRCPRDTRALIGLMERLDTASLVEQRRLTIPFLRAQLGRSGGE